MTALGGGLDFYPQQRLQEDALFQGKFHQHPQILGFSIGDRRVQEAERKSEFRPRACQGAPIFQPASGRVVLKERGKQFGDALDEGVRQGGEGIVFIIEEQEGFNAQLQPFVIVQDVL